MDPLLKLHADKKEKKIEFLLSKAVYCWLFWCVLLLGLYFSDKQELKVNIVAKKTVSTLS